MKPINKQCNSSAKQQLPPGNKPSNVKELQALTITQLDAIAGAGLTMGNHNETIVKLSNQPSKHKPDLENKPNKVNQLQVLTISELDAIAGAGGIDMGNHNETMVSLI